MIIDATFDMTAQQAVVSFHAQWLIIIPSGDGGWWTIVFLSVHH